MPTGYTAGVTETTTLAEFTMACARAFGALITMIDDPSDAPIPDEFKPSDHHVEALKRERARLAELRTMSAESATAMCAADYAQATASWRKSMDENAATRAKYERLIGLVQEWKPPTLDHIELRDFMVEQLRSSIECDCFDREKPVKGNPSEWLAAQIESAEWSVAYHEEKHREEVERARKRTEWVRELRASLRSRP